MICPFCNPNVISTQKIYETELCVALHNIRPATKGHIIIFPKRHAETLRDLTKDEAADLMHTVQHVAQVLTEHLNPIAMNFGSNEGKHAGQSVPHLHMHVMPRYEGDKLPEFHLFHRDPNTKRNLSKEELEPSVKEFREIFTE